MLATALIQFTLASATIVLAGIALTKCSDRLGEMLGLGRALAGIILMAAATSLPELSVAVSAVRKGLPDLAVGGLLGSNLLNLLVLGVIDVLSKTRGRMFSRLSGSHTLSGGVGISLMAMVGLAMASDYGGTLFNLGWGSWGILGGYLLAIRLVYYDQVHLLRLKGKKASKKPWRSWPKKQFYGNVAGYLCAAGVIFLAAPYLAEGAHQIVIATGLKESFVGTTFVALATSLPELVTTGAALKFGSVDMAVGNIFGSNSFNLVILGISDGFYGASLLEVASPSHLITCFGTIFITSIVIMGQVYHAEKRIALIEPDALLVILLVVGTLMMVYQAG